VNVEDSGRSPSGIRIESARVIESRRSRLAVSKTGIYDEIHTVLRLYATSRKCGPQTRISEVAHRQQVLWLPTGTAQLPTMPSLKSELSEQIAMVAGPCPSQGNPREHWGGRIMLFPLSPHRPFQ